MGALSRLVDNFKRPNESIDFGVRTITAKIQWERLRGNDVHMSGISKCFREWIERGSRKKDSIRLQYPKYLIHQHDKWESALWHIYDARDMLDKIECSYIFEPTTFEWNRLNCQIGVLHVGSVAMSYVQTESAGCLEWVLRDCTASNVQTTGIMEPQCDGAICTEI